MSKAAYVTCSSTGEGDRVEFTINYGNGKTANLMLLGLPPVREGEHVEISPALHEFLEALLVWRQEGGRVHW